MDYLFYSGYAALAFCWGLIARAAINSGGSDGSDPFISGKLAVARFYFARVLPRINSHKAAIEAGKATLMDVGEDALTVL